MPLAPGSSLDARAARVALVPSGKAVARTSAAELSAARLAWPAARRITRRVAWPSRCFTEAAASRVEAGGQTQANHRTVTGQLGHGEAPEEAMFDPADAGIRHI